MSCLPAVLVHRGALIRETGVFTEWSEFKFNSFSSPQMGVMANIIFDCMDRESREEYLCDRAR